MKKIIFTTIFTAVSSQAFAMAGFAERWFKGWVNDLFCTLTVAVIQLILIFFVFVFRNKMKQMQYNKIFNMIAANEPVSIAVGGLLLSFVISAYIDCVCGAFFIFGIFILQMIWVLDLLCVLFTTWRKKITNAKTILYMCLLSIGTAIGYAIYTCVVKYNWLTSLYSYQYCDSSMPDVDFIINPTRYPAVINIIIYTFILYFPWLICAMIKTLKYIRTRLHIIQSKVI